jgi:DNA-binding transcriptional regulator YdaS (Cro superfamily)
MPTDQPPRPPHRWLHLTAPKRLEWWRTRILKESQVTAAGRIGIDATKYNAFEHGRRRPSLDVATQIERVTGGYVKATQWAQAMELDERRRRVA